MQVTDAALTEVDIATAPAFFAEMREAIDWAASRAARVVRMRDPRNEILIES